MLLKEYDHATDELVAKIWSEKHSYKSIFIIRERIYWEKVHADIDNSYEIIKIYVWCNPTYVVLITCEGIYWEKLHAKYW